MNFDRKHEFHRRNKSHSMRIIIMIDVVTCVYIKTQPETHIYIYIYIIHYICVGGLHVFIYLGSKASEAKSGAARLSV